MTKIKTMPIWASSMVRNYKDQFKGRYGRETTLSNDQVFHITETVFDDSSGDMEDEARVEVMLEMEQNND